MWYQTCFFFACLDKISERSFWEFFSHDWRYSIFFFLQDQSFFFRTLEYYFASVDYLRFSPDFFRATSFRPTTSLLPYDQFTLRAPSLAYFTLWYHVEQIRLRFFNDYVKSHDYLNSNRQLSRRYRLQRRIFTQRIRMKRKHFLRYLFLSQALKRKYSCVEFTAVLTPDQGVSFCSSFNSFVSFTHSPSLNLALKTRALPMEPLAEGFQRFLLATTYLHINL